MVTKVAFYFYQIYIDSKRTLYRRTIFDSSLISVGVSSKTAEKSVMTMFDFQNNYLQFFAYFFTFWTGFILQHRAPMRFPDLFFAAAGDEDGEDESFEEDDDSFSSVVGSVLALLLFLLDLGGLRGLFCFSASPRYFPRALRSESESSEVTDESDKNNLFASFWKIIVSLKERTKELSDFSRGLVIFLEISHTLMFSSRRTRIGGGIINGRDGSYFSVANPTSGFRKLNKKFITT